MILFGLFNEEQMWPMVNTLGPNCDGVRSDMTYYETSGVGAVFSVGSIHWYSSLAWDGYKNNVATITYNVLREFEMRGRGGGYERSERRTIDIITRNNTASYFNYRIYSRREPQECEL